MNKLNILQAGRAYKFYFLTVLFALLSLTTGCEMVENTGRLYSLTVTLAGTGSGAITSNPAGINCGTRCRKIYPGGQIVTLTATPAVGSDFTGWLGGGCSGTSTCAVTMNGTTAVTATFTTSTILPPPPAPVPPPPQPPAPVLPPPLLPPPPPSAPMGIFALAGHGQVAVSWGSVADATSYNLYMASVSGVTKTTYSMQHTTVTNPYTHTGLVESIPFLVEIPEVAFFS